MKTIKLLFAAVILPFLLTSCVVDEHYHNDYVDNGITLPELMERYELWYVDYNATTGTGDVPFLTRAFTISLLDGTLYANNNVAYIGTTGNGFGIDIGYYDYSPTTIRFYHDVYGFYETEVVQISSNRIKLIDHNHNVTYYLTGYQRNNFDYDGLFYDNITYFLQEYTAWEKVYTSNAGALNDFDNEHFVQFLSSGNQFRSSQDAPGTPVNSIYWDFTGLYGVYNVPGNAYQKTLTLDYDFWGNESFVLTVINDNRIRLFHQASGTTYEFQGRGFIQFMKQGGKERVKKTDTTIVK
ncbi:nicotinic acid mononucleotide adenyltransferase [Flavobacterium enshiense]|uniref:nicotinic acid mononucleotide adenyltransferase n=1 Tax=Flavobacterium enshiense TaxID=1341165 RepID=UPI00345C8EA6